MRPELVVQSLAFVCSAAAFLGVIWPAIRRQERVAAKMEALLDNKKFLDTIAFYAGFAPEKKGNE
jgi:hypothetical protein